MAEVKMSKDGNEIDFTSSENVPTTVKKLRNSPELEAFYRFVYENDLRRESLQIINTIHIQRQRNKLASASRPKK